MESLLSLGTEVRSVWYIEGGHQAAARCHEFLFNPTRIVLATPETEVSTINHLLSWEGKEEESFLFKSYRWLYKFANNQNASLTIDDSTFFVWWLNPSRCCAPFTHILNDWWMYFTDQILLWNYRSFRIFHAHRSISSRSIRGRESILEVIFVCGCGLRNFSFRRRDFSDIFVWFCFSRAYRWIWMLMRWMNTLMTTISTKFIID